jgi:hypothetical protein
MAATPDMTLVVAAYREQIVASRHLYHTSPEAELVRRRTTRPLAARSAEHGGQRCEEDRATELSVRRMGVVPSHGAVDREEAGEPHA